ncbi:peptidase [Caldimicrobium thiodismutans]|uniref:Peptidase n=1 Tax=Caldimicrobium thiodismutans TaxID=1653476 RepID=A0A0U5B1P4_9BACT|nr:signal peptide peptidase SppA [Caldimicrobium thiodismutans]BAU24009.1 peptidase [Caldimicrobium thiodismutans]
MKRPWLVYGLAFVGGLVVFFLLTSFLFSLIFMVKDSSFRGGPKIGVLEVKGVILEAEPYLSSINELMQRKDIKAVLLRVDSPGGAVGACQEIFEQLKLLRKVKPLMVSMGEVAASGGLYLSLAGERIYANPGTITGSIGVMIQLPNFEKLMEKIGVSSEVIKSGVYKDTGSSFRKLSPDERAYLQEKVNALHDQFVKAIVEARRLPLEKVKTLANGKIYTGEEAVKLGLIDELGNFYQALEALKKRTGLKEVVLVHYPEKKGILKKFLEERLPFKSVQVFEPLGLRALYLLQI